MSQVPTAEEGHRGQRDSRLCPGTRHAPQAFQEGRPGLSIHLEDANRVGESELEVRQGPSWGRGGRRGTRRPTSSYCGGWVTTTLRAEESGEDECPSPRLHR